MRWVIECHKNRRESASVIKRISWEGLVRLCPCRQIGIRVRSLVSRGLVQLRPGTIQDNKDSYRLM
jgi:hypothetical protein